MSPTETPSSLASFSVTTPPSRQARAAHGQHVRAACRTRQTFEIGWYDERCTDVLIGTLPRDDGVFTPDLHRVGHDVRARENLLDDMRVMGILLRIRRDLQVEVLDLPELLLDDVVDTITQAQAREQKRRATGDADDGHEEAPLVAEEVACRNLAREREPAPDGPDALEQDAPWPALGARGSMRSAGRSRSEESTANRVASKVIPTLKAKANSAMVTSMGEELMGSA